MSRRSKPRPPKPPDLPPAKAHSALKQQLELLDSFRGRRYREVENDERQWKDFTLNVLIRGFGEDSNNVSQFHSAKWAGQHRLVGMTEGQIQRNFEKRIEAFAATIKSSIAELELIMPESIGSQAVNHVRFRTGNIRSKTSAYDVFISHASEDKDAIARPLAHALESKGLQVWFDEFSLSLGDSLREAIDAGLGSSRFGIVVLSPHFFEKHWPTQELNGLATREVNGTKIILPVWHNVSHQDVQRYSPILADRVAVSTEKGVEQVVDKILAAINALSQR